MKNIISNILKLLKFRIAIATGISSAVGYVLSVNTVSWEILGAFWGAFFLAAGAASMNQIQEWKFDAMMNRTKSRPIPTKFFTTREAIPLSIGFLIIGFSIILLTMISPISLLIGLSAFIFYNGFYTPLKRVSPFATIPGALIGVIPPILGWSLGNTDFLSAQLFSLIIFLFVWQMPHFYFLLFIFEEDYRNAGFPVLTDRFSKLQISRISFFWIFTLVIVSFMLAIVDPNFSMILLIMYFIAGIALLFRIRNLMFVNNTPRYYRLAFMQLNLYVLLVLISVSINKFII